MVAIKKIKLGNARDGVDMTALREIKLLQEVHHENVVEVGRRPSDHVPRSARSAHSARLRPKLD